MTEGSLRNVVVVEPVVVPEHRVQVGAGVEVRRPQDFSDSAVEALHQPVGLGMARRREPVLDAVFRAELVEDVLPRGLPALLGEAIREGLVVVREQDAQMKRGLLVQVLQKARGGPLGLLPVALQINPAAGAVDGDEQIRPAVLVSHGRQVLDVYMDVARLVVLERLRLRLALGLRDEGPAVRDTVAHQQPLQRGAI